MGALARVKRRGEGASQLSAMSSRSQGEGGRVAPSCNKTTGQELSKILAGNTGQANRLEK